jgi:small subunit ribosomal protein S16
MSVKIRMRRLGNRNRPFYRVNAIDTRTKRDGKVIEELGYYNPIEKDEAKALNLKLERVAYWLSVGAQPSDTVASLIKKKGLNPKPGTKVEAQTLPQPA